MAPAFRLLHLQPMPVKDYYKILGLEPGATEREIKKGFRQLAKRYHPDTNQGNQYSEAWFRELQEAYDTLTDPAKKEAYLQERWLQQSMGKRLARPEPLTPPVILKEAADLLATVNTLDHFRMDHQALYNNILAVLSDEKLDMLSSFADKACNRQIARLLMEATEHLDDQYITAIFNRVKRLCQNDPDLLSTFQQMRTKRKKAAWWSKNQWWILLLATMALCGMIYLLAG